MNYVINANTHTCASFSDFEIKSQNDLNRFHFIFLSFSEREKRFVFHFYLAFRAGLLSMQKVKFYLRVI